MAELIDLNKKNKIILKPVRYEQKDELWFSSELGIERDGREPIKVYAPFHLNDFINLIDGIKLLTRRKGIFFVFDPIEPYLKLIIKLIDDEFFVEAYFCKGPVFEPSKYEELKFEISEENLTKFIKQLESDLRYLDTKIELQYVNYS